MLTVDMLGQLCPIPAVEAGGADCHIAKASVTDYLDFSGRSVAAVIGCGGKTSFVGLVADRLRDKKVLVSPTTKMFPMKKGGVTLCETLEQCEEHRPHVGIQYLGLTDAASDKLKALPENILAGMIPRYDIALLEADGSRGLPCKGWLEDEPVIPRYCTHTVGIVTLAGLGRAATEAYVHNLPEFLSLTGLNESETIRLEALESMVCAPEGMFKNSAGRRYLLVNQVEDDTAARTAQIFLRGIKKKYPGRFARLLYGSVYLDVWREV